MQSNLSKIAVISVIYKNKKTEINKFIEMLISQKIPRKNIFIRDNTSNNIGYAPAINLVLKKIISKFDFFLILNPDIALRKNCVKYLLETSQNKNVDIVGPRIITSSGKHIDGGRLDKIRYSSNLVEEISKGNTRYVDADYISGSAIFVSRDVFKKIGLFPEDYFIYYEEVDFCLKARKSGFKLIVDAKAKISHQGSKTVGKNSPAMYYYMARNHLLFLEKFAPLHIKFREALRLPKTLLQARKRKYELLGIRDYFLRKFRQNVKIKNSIDL